MREDMIYNPHLYQIRPFQLERMLAIAHARKDARAGGVVFYGDSLTEFYPVARCFAALVADGGPGVYNAGIGGATTEELLWYVDEAVIRYRPRALLDAAGSPLALLYRPGDGLHINDAGYDRVTAVLEPKLRALLTAAD